MAASEWADLVKIVGLPTALLVLAAVTGSRRKWVFGWAYDLLREDYEELLAKFETLTEATRGATELARQLAQRERER